MFVTGRGCLLMLLLGNASPVEELAANPLRLVTCEFVKLSKSGTAVNQVKLDNCVSGYACKQRVRLPKELRIRSPKETAYPVSLLLSSMETNKTFFVLLAKKLDLVPLSCLNRGPQ
ncbi:hypothetical protein Tco_0238638 [Tanacetum coccineum]